PARSPQVLGAHHFWILTGAMFSSSFLPFKRSGTSSGQNSALIPPRHLSLCTRVAIGFGCPVSGFSCRIACPTPETRNLFMFTVYRLLITDDRPSITPPSSLAPVPRHPTLYTLVIFTSRPSFLRPPAPLQSGRSRARVRSPAGF